MPPLTAISPPVGTYALIFYSHWGNASHCALPPPQIRLALGSGTDVKSQSDFLVRP